MQKEDRGKIDSLDKPSIYGCEGLFFFSHKQRSSINLALKRVKARPSSFLASHGHTIVQLHAEISTFY